MKNKAFFLILLLALLLASPVAAQITLGPSLLQSVIGRRTEGFHYTATDQNTQALQAILQATGPNQTYDFSALTYGPPAAIGITVLGSAAGTPGEGDPLFDQANYVNPVGGNTFAYFRLQDDGFYLLGSLLVSTSDLDGDGTPDRYTSKYDPPERQFAFPLTDGTSWAQDIVVTSEGPGSTTLTHVRLEAVVEGWGTLVTPAGGSLPALRVRKTRVTRVGADSIVVRVLQFVTESRPDAMVSASIVMDGSGNVYSGGAAYSVQRLVATAVEESTPHTFELEQNYPNPFNPVTTIRFTLKESGPVSLRVYDLTGRLLNTLVHGVKPAGLYEVSWNGQDEAGQLLPSGIYFYRLEAGASAEVRAMALTK